jgi:diguanylate cyclase (GGDEF)-like protein/PAS domain S-box-containing protein
LAVLVLLAAASALWVFDSANQRRSRLIAQATQAGETQAQELKSALERNLTVLEIASALVQEGNGTVPRFADIGTQLLRNRPSVRTFGLLPEGVLTQVVPDSDSARLLGVDVLNGPSAHPDAIQAVIGNALVVSAPTSLRPGQLEIWAHQPVYLASDGDASSRFWGLVRTSVDLKGLLDTSRLSILGDQGFDYQLLGPDGGLLHSSLDAASVLEQPLVLPVVLYNQHWQLKLSPVSGWGGPLALAVQLVWGALFSAGGAGLVFLLLNNIRLAHGTLGQLASQVPGVLYQYHQRPDGHTWFSYISPGVQALTGFTAEALRESDAEWRAHIVPEDRRDMRAAVQISALHLSPLETDFRLTTLDGQTRWFWTKALPQRQPDGTVTWNGYLADWTQEKQTEDALVQSGQLLAEAQEVARLGYFITDVANGTWTSSTLLDHLFGIDSTFDRTAKGWSDLVEPEHREALREAYQTAVADRSGFNVEYAIRRPADDRVVWVQAIGRLEFDDAGVPVRIVGTVQDITARKKAEAEIRNLAYYDPLTGLPNRRLLLDRLAQTLQLRRADHAHGALMFIDLDNFKDLNDTLGHDKGDALLRLVALRLLACVREVDTVCRLGGDEFVLLLSRLELAADDSPAQVVESIGLNVLAALARPYPLAGMHLTSTPSIGVALFADEGLAVDEVIKRADVAMYQAKAAGRNTLRFYDPAIQAEMAERMQLAEDLRGALACGQLRLVYQPQHDDTGRLVGAEALLRWLHPQRGPMSPAVFIPLAEQVGLMSALGQWVLHEACQQLSTWFANPALGVLRQGFTLAVNVSAHQFRSPDFVADVSRVLAHAGLPPRTLKLELTESLMVHDVEDIIAKMNAVRPMGVLFSLDDFGTGYSSLTYLKRLPLDQLKIDQSFVRDVQTSPNDAAIARTVLALGQTLGLDVIAEGVETEAQKVFLREMGCLSYQGYLFSKPLESKDFQVYALDCIQ